MGSKSIRNIKLKVPGNSAGQRLDQFLAESLPKALGAPLSKAKIRKLIVIGGVYLNRKRVRIASKSMFENAVVDVQIDLDKLQNERTSPERIFSLTDKNILFEDDEIIIVDKPAGIPTQPTLDQARDHLFAAVKRFLRARGGVEPYVGLHHRLDYDTSGIVLFTKRASANKWVADLFANRQIEKTYHALTIRAPSKSVGETWSIDNYLDRSKKRTAKVSFMEAVRSGGQHAHTDFKILKASPRQFLVEAKPKTGRTHQVRVHLQQSELPIMGDALYGGPEAERIFLHARALKFLHGNGQEIVVECPYPEVFEKRCEDLTGPRGP